MTVFLANVTPQQSNPVDEAMSENINFHVSIHLEETAKELTNIRSHESPTWIQCHTTLQHKVCNHIVATTIKHGPSVFTKTNSFGVANYRRNGLSWSVRLRITQGTDVCSVQIAVRNLVRSTINNNTS
jgi:hypothetical protein